MKEHYSHAATILPVRDVQRSLAFYQDKLGFENTFKWGDPVDYAVMKAGNVSIHLTQSDKDFRPNSQHIAVMIFVSRIDELYKALRSEGVNITSEIGDRDYAMRDFDIADPDGHLLSFGQGIEL